jgi:prolipoprotein diacylglyceryltransferase
MLLPVLAVIEVSFDPLLHIGELTVRWQTIGVTLALLVALAVAALMAPDLSSQRPFFRRPSRPDLAPRFPDAPVIDRSGDVSPGTLLRLDDMVLIIAGIVPGAVVGGRLIHGVVFWEAYAADPARLFDPSVGALSLLGAVLGGLFSAAYVARLIGAPVRRWADAAAVPMLLAIGLGKLAQFLGGSGQGLPFDGPWAVAFTGLGPWVSMNPDIPSHPAQLYEGLWVLLGIPLVLRWSGPRRSSARVNRWVAWASRSVEDGRLFVNALNWFLLGRVIVGFTWRDDPTIGPLNSEQAVALAVLIGAELGFRLRARNRVLLAAP